LSHTIFALPLAIFLIHNFMRELPAELMEAARVDGAGHVTIFFKILLPLLTPALAAFGIFQFLWVWNDLLVSLVFPTVVLLTSRRSPCASPSCPVPAEVPGTCSRLVRSSR
jgi:ABC-type glycerol-3-phosphate transport system permease component